jgi:hypothetical protein
MGLSKLARATKSNKSNSNFKSLGVSLDRAGAATIRIDKWGSIPAAAAPTPTATWTDPWGYYNPAAAAAGATIRSKTWGYPPPAGAAAKTRTDPLTYPTYHSQPCMSLSPHTE